MPFDNGIPGDYSCFRWSPEDNMVGETELQLSRILTKELTSRPAISLQVLFASHQIQQEVGPILVGLEKKLGKLLKAETKEYREGGTRKVIVVIKPF